jgi:uncharacterized protein (DUF433 family)
MLDTQSAAQLITCDPKIVSGTPVFSGTRVPIKNLFDYLKGGHDFEEFLVDFPGVSLEQAKGVLELAQQLLLARITSK